MEGNDVFRRLRYIFDYDDDTMMSIFKLAEKEVSRAQLSDWLKKDDNPEFEKIYDKDLASFLNGFINLKRGKREGPQPVPEDRLNNNQILRKLKIALNLKVEDIVKVFDIAEFQVSKHEISAFFRNPKQNQYRLCKDQFLRNFLIGLQIKHRGH